MDFRWGTELVAERTCSGPLSLLAAGLTDQFGARMASLDTTCWTLIEAAAGGRREDREEFAQRYQGPVEAYLRARWAGSPLVQETDDAVQEFFLECFRGGGFLDHVKQGGPGGFRAFLYGVARNVALRVERRGGRRKERQSPGVSDLNAVAVDETSLSRVFDRSWALALLGEAVRRHADEARSRDEAAQRRVELLRLRFQENLPIREIAQRWKMEASVIHHEYARARDEFKEVLLAVVTFHCPSCASDGERECAELLAALH